MNPTADDIAVAICAACRETGENPIECASGALSNRGRHYALHALLHVFPKADKIKLCVWVGCPGKPKAFWNASWHQVIKPRSSGLGHMAMWWEDDSYDRVIRAVEANKTRRAVSPPIEGRRGSVPSEVPSPRDPPRPEPGPDRAPPPYRPPPGTIEKVLRQDRPASRLGTRDASGYRPPPDAIARILDDDDRPVIDRSGTFSARKTREQPRLTDKAELRRALAEAAANTANIKTPG